MPRLLQSPELGSPILEKQVHSAPKLEADGEQEDGGGHQLQAKDQQQARPIKGEFLLILFVSFFLSQVEVEYARALNRANEEADHEEDLFAFQNLTSLEAQMASLKTKGFMRSYKAYQPPADLAPRFVSVCSKVLGLPVAKESLGSIPLDNLDKKAELLKALHREFGHLVHSSRLHEMKTLERLFLFYSSEVCSLNPYEQLHRDKEADLLPPNLVINKDPIRFTGQGDHPLDQVCFFISSGFLGSLHKVKTTSSGHCLAAVGHSCHRSQKPRKILIETSKAFALGGARLQIASSSHFSPITHCRVTWLAMPPRIKRPSRRSYLNWEAGLAIGVGICAGAYIWPPIFREVTNFPTRE